MIQVAVASVSIVVTRVLHSAGGAPELLLTGYLLQLHVFHYCVSSPRSRKSLQKEEKGKKINSRILPAAFGLEKTFQLEN
jgi:hypothetical protein